MSESAETRVEIAARILAGFAANPAIFAANNQCGWSLVNCSDSDLVAYSRKLADDVIAACQESST